MGALGDVKVFLRRVEARIGGGSDSWIVLSSAEEGRISSSSGASGKSNGESVFIGSEMDSTD